MIEVEMQAHAYHAKLSGHIIVKVYIHLFQLQVTVGRRRRSITQRSPRHVLQSRGEMQRTKRQENSVTLVSAVLYRF